MKALVAALAIALVGSAFLWKATDGFQALTAESARRIAVLRDRPMLPDTRLQTMSSEVVGVPSAERKVTMVEFIYATCPTICQSAGADLARLREAGVDEFLLFKSGELSFEQVELTGQLEEAAAVFVETVKDW